MKRILLTLAVCAFLAAFAPPSQAEIVNARSVVLTNNGPAFLSVFEMDIYDVNGVDYASSANGATASAVPGGPWTWGSPEGAIDDVVNAPLGPNVYHSDGPPAVLTIDFGGNYDIEKVDYTGRLDCCGERGDNFLMDFYDGPNGTGNLLRALHPMGAGTASIAAQGSVTIFDEPAIIPEPSSLVLAVLAVVSGLGLFSRRQRRRH